MRDPFPIGRSKIRGRGVFASRDIGRGEKVCDMKGMKIKAEDIGELRESGRNPVVDPLQIDFDEYVNLEEPYVLINHSCDPNTGLRNRMLYAIRNIKKGEEITYDYSSAWFDGFECNCGSKNCRRHIGDFTSIPITVRKRYFSLGIVPEFIKKTFEE